MEKRQNIGTKSAFTPNNNNNNNKFGQKYKIYLTVPFKNTLFSS